MTNLKTNHELKIFYDYYCDSSLLIYAKYGVIISYNSDDWWGSFFLVLEKHTNVTGVQLQDLHTSHIW